MTGSDAPINPTLNCTLQAQLTLGERQVQLLILYRRAP